MQQRSALAWLPAALLALFVSMGAPAQEFLPPQEAFKYSAEVRDGQLQLRYQITDGYYLYRNRLGFEASGAALGTPSLPRGEDHEDDYFGRQEIYRGSLAITIPIQPDPGARDFELTLKLQGCADGGLCYPPQTWKTRVNLPAAAASTTGAGSGSGFSLKRLLGQDQPAGDGEFLPPDQAFVLSADSSSVDRVTIRFAIADEYYLYRDKLKFSAPAEIAQLGRPALPEGKLKHDEYFGEQIVYYGELEAVVPVSARAGTTELPLEVSYQGCADAGLCYPPITRAITVQLGSAPAAAGPPAAPTMVSEQDRLAERIRSGNLLAVLATFFGAGLLLAFTPCVLPMVPILSGIIVGAGRGEPVSRGRAFTLSVAYVLGMAFTYTVAGAAFAAVGQQAQAFFQKPWIIALFAALFVWLALGMFGVFNLQIPAALQSRISELSSRQKQGSLLGTAVMGALSSLIVTACVAPPLVAALAVIGQSGDVLRGGAALFALSLGMGAPLLLVGASAGRLLPKAGPWMDAVKALFGVMLLGVAIWMLGRILPGPVTLALWAMLAFVTGYVLFTARTGTARGPASAVLRGVGALAIVYGVLLLVGALSGRSNPLQPLAGLVGPPASESTAAALPFTRIKSVADLESALAAAAASGRPAMLDFYADWCVSCKEMEHYTFTDAGVQAELEAALLLQADVTANDAEDQALLQHFGILGPPTIVFFGPDGREQKEFRVVGFMPADEFRGHVALAFGGGAR
jgi:thiol:disulfide interchange protein DsbD